MFDKRLFGAAAASLLSAARAQQPQQIPFNTSVSAGPDGPWNFITLQIGSGPSSAVDFYPMLSDQASMIVADDVCAGDKSQCLNPLPGYYNTGSQSYKSNPQNIVPGDQNVTQYDGGLSDQLSWSGKGHFWVDAVGGDIKANNVSFFVATDITQKDGGKPYKPLSLLSLEPNADHNQVKTTTGNATATTLLGHYTNTTKGASTSFSIHMGSAAYNQSGSLFLGGYDPTRVIESPAVFPHLGFIRLNTISFGSASGDSPWANTSLPSDFLGKPADIIISPHVPHIYLAQEVCDLMSQHLPISYDNETNLFLWNTSSPAYHDIVTSPSYLNFTFGDTAHTSIRVPFTLLNLIMTAPLKNRPTQYFPCSGRPNLWNLGRAFLQSAMLMQNYNPDYVMVAQAPGPFFKQSTPTPSAISSANPTISPPPNAPKWEATWQGLLTPLGSNSNSNSNSGVLPTGTPSSSTTSSRLTGGAIAGVVIGALGGVVLIAGLVLFSHRYRSKRANPSRTSRPRDPGARSYISRPSLHHPGQSQSSVPPMYSPTYQYVHTAKEKIVSPIKSPGSPRSGVFEAPTTPRSVRSQIQAPASVYKSNSHHSNHSHHSFRSQRSNHSAHPSHAGLIPILPAARRGVTPLVEVEGSRGIESVELDSRPSTRERFELADNTWSPAEMSASRFSRDMMPKF